MKEPLCDVPVELIPLAEAVLCENCQVVGRQRTDKRCPSCGSQSVLFLGVVLGRSSNASEGRMMGDAEQD
jgi:primosomal protein N'